MNLFQLQENLKNFSQDQLVNEMRNPTGTAPQYLVLSELQRRRRIMQEEQAQMPQQQTTVAEDAVAASGVPQGGIAQMAQALAPQTDTGMNTARMFGGGGVGSENDRKPVGLPEGTNAQDVANFIKQDPSVILGAATGTNPFGSMLEFIANGMTDAAGRQADGPSQQVLAQQMNAGPTDARMAALEQYKSLYSRPTLPVRGMSEGGLSGVSPRLTDFMPIGPSSRRASGRGIAITPMQMGQSIYEDYIDEMRRREAERRGSAEGLTGMTAEEVNRRANQGRYDPADANPPTLGARDIAALAGADPIDLRGEVEFPTMGAGLSSLLSPAPSRGLDDIIDGLAGDSVESRFDPTDELRTFMSPAERARMILNDPEIADRAAALDLTPEQYISSLSPARQDAALQSAVNRAAAVASPAPRAAEDRMMFGETPIGAIQSERAAMPVSQNIPTQFDAPSASRFVGTDLADDARALRTAAYVEENLARDAAGLPERERVGMSDRAMAAQMDGPFDVDVTAEDVLAGVNAMYPDQSMSANELANLELQGFDDTDQSGDPGYGFGDMARDIFGDAAIDEIIRNREIGRERERTRDAASRFETEAEAADAEIAALDREALAAQFEAEGEVADAEQRLPVVDLTEQREGSGGGAGGGAGGAGGAGGGMSSDDLYNQDKWLALAQAGLSLMSSRAPTFGEALGQAGQTGIAALMQARGDRQDRIEAAQARADRLAAAAARAARDDSERYPYRQIDDIIGLADSYQGQADAIIEALGGVPNEGDPEYQDYVNNLALANTYRNYAREAIGIQ